MADPVAAARNFLNAMEKIPSIIDQYKSKNEVLEKEIPQLQEIAGKVWKKEDELKQLKSELAALDRKIQLELAPPMPEVAEKETDGQEVTSHPPQQSHPIADGTGMASVHQSIGAVSEPSGSIPYNRQSAGKFRL